MYKREVENSRRIVHSRSYPSTKTNIFPKELNLTTSVEQQIVNQEWSNCTKFAGIWNNFQIRKKATKRILLFIPQSILTICKVRSQCLFLFIVKSTALISATGHLHYTFTLYLTVMS